MAMDWGSVYNSFRSNAADYPGVLPLLGEDLGVSAASLDALGVGFAPVVRFAKRIGTRWWVNPERDAQGRIVGLSLRSQDDGTKVMYPGSKHGLVYPLREGYVPGRGAYVPGKHNWVRTMDAGLNCPVCGKPDGCLLSAENPSDPKAVMCIREGAGAVGGRADNGGWLHIRKPEGHLRPGGPLPDSDHPVVIVEGMSDTAAALDLGFVAVGRPSNLAGLGYLKELVKGRRVIILGENDVATNSRTGRVRYPGREGMEAAFEVLKQVCDATKVMPPEGFKDLRSWCNAGLTREGFLAHVEQNGIRRGDSRLLESTEPLQIAERWLAEEHTEEGVLVLRKYAGQWYRFDGRFYTPCQEEADVRGRLYGWLTDRYVKVGEGDKTKVVPYAADRSKVGNIIDALTRDCPISADPPCWLDGRETPDPRSLVCFPNGLLDVDQYMADGSIVLHPLTPHYFTFHVRPYDFDPDARCPMWLEFLAQTFPDDPKKIALLQEWGGLLQVPDISFQKMCLFLGPPGTGKSTTLYVLERVLGSDEVAQTSLDNLGERHGAAHLIGKLAAFVPDGHIGRYTDSTLLLERLKVLTGENGGRMAVRRMREDATDAHFYARITIATNEPPEWPDEANALHRRMLPLLFTERCKSPDRGLPDRLATEAPGIFNWFLEGLARLRYRGEFTVPDSSAAMAEKLSLISSPLRQFVYECCTVSSAETVALDTLFAAWKNWRRETGGVAGMALKFAHNLELNIPTVRLVREVGIDGLAVPRMAGIALTQPARERYLAR